MSDRSAPVYYVQIVPPGASTVPIDVTLRTISLDADSNDMRVAKLDLQLDNFDLSLLDDPNWKKGNGLIASWGYLGNTKPPQEFVIQKITGSLVLKVTALAKSILMNKIPRSRGFEAMKRSAIVAQIAAENGYGPDAQFIDDTAIVVPHTHQARMTDGQFLMHLALREGFTFHVAPDGLHFERRKVNTKPVREFVYYTDPEQGDILTWNLENDVTAVPGRVQAKGRDPLAKKDIDVSGSNEDTSRDGTAPIVEVVDPRTKTTATAPVASTVVISTTEGSAAAAKREVDGKFTLAQQTVAILSVDVIGDPRIAIKQIVRVSGISKRLSGLYYVKELKEKVSASEYTMTMTLRGDGGHKAGAAASDANKNTKPDADPDALVPIEVVDPRTKTTHIEYRKPSDGGT
jgi:phage protein D